MAADRVIRWSTAGAVVGVAAVASVASYEHPYALVRAHGEAGWTAQLVPLTVDGLVYASSLVMLDSARRKVPVPALARWLLGLGIAATLAANVAHGMGHGLIGAAVAPRPAIALIGSYELSPGTRSLLRDVALECSAEAFAIHLVSVVLVVIATEKTSPRGPAANATPCAATASCWSRIYQCEPQ
jgi:hypothetical protein